MALEKQSLKINFAQGLDTKTDPNQVAPGRMLSLQNTIFDKGGLLQKRNGYQPLTSLPANSAVTLTTLNDGLLAVGTSLYALSQDNNQWVNAGAIQSVDVNALSVVRTATSQTTVDIAVTSNGFACAVYYDSAGNSYYQVFDSETGQIIVASTQLPATANMPRVFALGNYFVVMFIQTVSATPTLRMLAIPFNNPTSPIGPTTISSQVNSLTAGWDGVVMNGSLYVAWNSNDPGGSIRVTRIDSILIQHNVRKIAGYNGDRMSICADSVTSRLFVTYWDSVSTNAVTSVLDSGLGVILVPTTSISSTVIPELVSAAHNGTAYLFYQVQNTYSYSSTRSDFIKKVSITDAGVVGTPSVIARSVGIASKAFYFSPNGSFYLMVAYGGAFQPSYFLMDSSGNISAKLAYSNGSGYATNQILPQANVNGSVVAIGYLFKDQLVPVNRSQGVASVAGIYSQNGVNLATFTINANALIPAEVAECLHLTGGFLWMYDGVKPVENNFHVWPEDAAVTTNTLGGSISAQQYYYVFTYEWTDGQGNIHRSAPSVPYGVTTTGATSTNTIKVPTLRLTYKTGTNPVRIVGYRWSTAQQNYYQFTSISSPTLNDTTVDSVTITDTLADSSILGNALLYTTGGIVENIGPPAASTMTLFKSRLFLVDAEDRNKLWFSKQVIESTPVEMSDLFTIFVTPTVSAQGSTGPITALASLDDKLIIFKKDAIYYLVGNGPDNSGANNDFSDPVFIASTVGCAKQQSIVFIPEGLIFESDKGKWLLGRDLNTQYIGAPVEEFNGATTLASVNVPATNQVRFTLNSNITLMYDYFFRQWGTFTNVPAISSTIYQGLHTYLNSSGHVFQENPGVYTDGTSPVLMSFTTGWFGLAGLQGFERAYFFYLLGTYLSPHKLSIGIAYDFDPSVQQSVLITPDNYSAPWGGDTLWGSSSPWGGPSSVEQWRVFLQRQKCQAFQISLSEVFDSSFGVMPGAGFSLSGINLIVGAKGSYPRLASKNYAG